MTLENIGSGWSEAHEFVGGNLRIFSVIAQTLVRLINSCRDTQNVLHSVAFVGMCYPYQLQLVRLEEVILFYIETGGYYNARVMKQVYNTASYSGLQFRVLQIRVHHCYTATLYFLYKFFLNVYCCVINISSHKFKIQKTKHDVLKKERHDTILP